MLLLNVGGEALPNVGEGAGRLQAIAQQIRAHVQSRQTVDHSAGEQSFRVQRTVILIRLVSAGSDTGSARSTHQLGRADTALLASQKSVFTSGGGVRATRS